MGCREGQALPQGWQVLCTHRQLLVPLQGRVLGIKGDGAQLLALALTWWVSLGRLLSHLGLSVHICIKG